MLNEIPEFLYISEVERCGNRVEIRENVGVRPNDLPIRRILAPTVEGNIGQDLSLLRPAAILLVNRRPGQGSEQMELQLHAVQASSIHQKVDGVPHVLPGLAGKAGDQ